MEKETTARSMNSLKVKILGLITVIMVTIVAVSAFINYQMQKQMHQEVAAHHTALLMDTIKNSIKDAMRSGRSESVHDMLASIQSQRLIKGLRIVDNSGKILNSSEKGEIGRFLPVSERPEISRNSSSLNLIETTGFYDSYSPILNEPDCHRCHPASQKVLGLLEIELSIDYLDTFIHKERHNAVTSTFVIILLIFITLYIFLTAYVDRPIRRMIESMQLMETGNFDIDCSIKSSKEMELLSTNFTRMARKIKQVLDTAISHERELAHAQGKLAHHLEIHQMNQKLEDQIKEIEQLNISLEERIEEIEEANFKIVDLAADLEDKNTNLEKAVSRLSTLYKVGLGINSTMDLQKLFDLIVTTSIDTLHALIGNIILYDKSDDHMTVITLVGHDDCSGEEKVLPMDPSIVSAWVIRNRKPLLIADMNDAPQFDRFSPLGYEHKSVICAPLIIKDEAIGAITVINKSDDSVYGNEDLELLTTIAAQASIAIKNAQLYDEQQKTYMNTIQALVSAIEASDSYTRGHSERVTRLSVALAGKLELPPERIKIVERAAVLHDIGKIGIDLTLLHKPGKLSPEEINDLQQHPMIGMKILEPIEFLSDVRTCIGQHHERYDGQGYPSGIGAEHLLLESRILAIADAFDAMTSDRPYRKALPLSVAVKELVDHAGTQFDPMLVPPFVELVSTNTFTPHLADPQLRVKVSPFPVPQPTCVM
jgi:putative nucleotidyltransferase with HDIG domain